MEPTSATSTASIAKEYFDYLGSNLPHQTASDEFYFLPRCEAAVDHMGNLDRLTPIVTTEHLIRVREMLAQLPTDGFQDLEEEIDAITIRESMERFLWQFEKEAVWRTDPTLYLKIPLFAMDEIMSRESIAKDEIRGSMADLLLGLPSFLELGRKNVSRPSEIAVSVCRKMAGDGLAFLRKDVPRFIDEKMSGDILLSGLMRKACEEWGRFARQVSALKDQMPFAMGEERYGETLAIGVGTDLSPAEVLAAAEEGFHETLERATALARSIDSNKDWRDLLTEPPHDSGPEQTLPELYGKEVANLRDFFHSKDVFTFPEHERVHVTPTPSYLTAVRATAAYRAPLTGRANGVGVFQISPLEGSSHLIAMHCPYLSSHETYPGHHILDALRTAHPNPIRRQIESPLFYEGWACYGETLLDELGYVTQPRLQLAQLQRQLWRNLRSMLDVKLQTGAVTILEAQKEIEAIGFSSATAERQIRRFCLSPGYQSCYFLGMREILRLREKYAHRMGLKAFHDTLLGGGQIGFRLVERRLEAAP